MQKRPHFVVRSLLYFSDERRIERKSILQQRAQAATMAARRPINWEQSPAPNQRNRVASRPDFVATKRGSECPRIPPAPNKACKPPPRRRSARQIGNKVLLRIKLDFESLPDSKSLRLSAAAIISGHRPPLPDPISSRPNAAAIVRGYHPPQTKRASRHHGGAARVKLGTKSCSEPSKKLSRFPTQFRRDQTRQQPSAGTARRQHGGAARVKLGTKSCSEPS